MFFGILVIFVELVGIPNAWKINLVITIGILMIIFSLLYKFYAKVMEDDKFDYSDEDNGIPSHKPVLQSVDDKRYVDRKYKNLVS